MKFIGTKSLKPLSILIRLITGEPISHFAIVFNSPGGGLMFESNLLDTHPKFYRTAEKHMTVVDEIEIKLPLEQEDQAWDHCIDRFDDRGYDFWGAIYLGLMVLRERIFGDPRPLYNKWATEHRLFCDEVWAICSDIPGLPQIDVRSGMKTPGEVIKVIKDWKATQGDT